MTATVEDNDQDTDSETVDISALLQFDDAQPTITAQHEAPAEALE